MLDGITRIVNCGRQKRNPSGHSPQSRSVPVIERYVMSSCSEMTEDNKIHLRGKVSRDTYPRPTLGINNREQRLVRRGYVSPSKTLTGHLSCTMRGEWCAVVRRRHLRGKAGRGYISLTNVETSALAQLNDYRYNQKAASSAENAAVHWSRDKVRSFACAITDKGSHSMKGAVLIRVHVC